MIIRLTTTKMSNRGVSISMIDRAACKKCDGKKLCIFCFIWTAISLFGLRMIGMIFGIFILFN